MKKYGLALGYTRSIELSDVVLAAFSRTIPAKLQWQDRHRRMSPKLLRRKRRRTPAGADYSVRRVILP